MAQIVKNITSDCHILATETDVLVYANGSLTISVCQASETSGNKLQVVNSGTGTINVGGGITSENIAPGNSASYNSNGTLWQKTEYTLVNPVTSPIKSNIAAGGYGIMTLKSITSTKTLTNARTNVIALQVPAGAKLVGCQLRNDTIIAGKDDATGLTPITSFAALYSTGATQSIGTTIALAKNTKTNKFFDANAATDITSGATDITVDAGSGNKFTAGGVISAIAYYYEFTSITSL